MLHTRLGFVSIVCLLLLVLVGSSPAWAQTPGAGADAESAAPPQERLVVRDVSVYVSDAFGGKLNRSGLFGSTLPRFVSTRRKDAEPIDYSQATPVGLITFQGEPGALIDVLLEMDDGTFLGAWPKGQRRRSRLLWSDLELRADLVSEPGLPDGHWLAPLREAPRLAAQSGRTADRFILYDAEFDHPNDLKLVVRDGQYGVLYFGKSTVHDVTLYKPVEGGWVTGSVKMIHGKADDAAEEPAEVEPEPAEDAPAASGREAELRALLEARRREAEATAEEAAASVEEAAARIDALLAARLAEDRGHDHDADASGEPSKHFTIKSEGGSRGTYSISLTIEQITPTPRLSVRDHTISQYEGRDAELEEEINNEFGGFSYQTPPNPGDPSEAYKQIAEHLARGAGEDSTAQLMWDHIDDVPQWDDEDGASAAVAMSGEVLGRDAVMTSWESKLADLGMGGPEVAHVLAILASSALDEKQMTAVYRLDAADVDRMLPIEVVPAADRVSRAALVILINADPDLAGRVDELIAQLGDPSWARREAAHKELLKIGPGAKQKLEAALSNSDMEIVYRAEQLLEAINNPLTSR